ncbi:MAG: pilus assembly protein [Rhizobiales bacterium]|nr:pilus assembly protein [Hyphomicrobiales bacterium]
MTRKDLFGSIPALAAAGRAFLSRARRDERGVSAIEFGIVVTLMVPMLFALAETTQGLQINRKVSIAARALADLASQTAAIADADMKNIKDAASDVLAPFPVANARVTLTGIKIDDKGKATVGWSDARNGTSDIAGYACGATMSVPADLMPPLGKTGFLVLAEVTYNYRPAVPWFMPASVTLSDRLYAGPRIGASVTRTGTGAVCP